MSQADAFAGNLSSEPEGPGSAPSGPRRKHGMVEQIGEYQVRRLIGEGGMGKVYEAAERLSKRRVALKVLHPELAKSDHARKLFLNEMQILAHLEHPNIVRSLASLEHAGEMVMVLEYLDGRTLRTVVGERGRLPWTEAVAIAASTARALSAAHGQEPPIIHRDLKPENIMVLEGGNIKVMDFGIAKVIEALNQTNTQSVGTLQYMSPEQIDAHTIDHRSDLYCLGLILYELIEGKPPFTSASPRQLLNMQCTAEPPPLSPVARQGLPQGVEQLLFQLLEKAPEDRPYMADDVIERLEPFLPAQTPLTLGKPLSPRNSRASNPSAASAAAAMSARSAERPSHAQVSADTPQRPAIDIIEPKKQAPIQRADTIALLERTAPAREVPRLAAVGIIVALSLLAGILAYVVRTTSSAAPSGGADSAAPTTGSAWKK